MIAFLIMAFIAAIAWTTLPASRMPSLAQLVMIVIVGTFLEMLWKEFRKKN